MPKQYKLVFDATSNTALPNPEPMSMNTEFYVNPISLNVFTT